MSDWVSRVVITRTKEYTLRLPTNWAEVSKALLAIRAELGEDKSFYEDAVTVTGSDDEIVFSYVISTTTEHPAGGPHG